MLESIVNLAPLIIAALGILTATFYVGSWYRAVNVDRSSFDQFMKSTSGRMGRIDKRMGQIDKRMDITDKKIEKIDKKIEKIYGRMEKTDQRIIRMSEQILSVVSRLPEPDDTIRSVSPKSLTDLGKKVAEEIDAPLIVDDLVESIYTEAQDMSPYDVQEMCYDFVETWTPPEDVANRIKNCAYQNGISWEKTVAVVAIQLRDRILERQNKEEQQPVA